MCSCGADSSSDINSTVNRESGGITILSKLHIYDIFDIVVDNDGSNIYIADKEHILITDKNGNKKTEIKGFSNSTCLALGNNSLYALDRREGGDIIKEFSLNGKLKQEISINTSTNNVIKIDYANGNLILLQYDKSMGKSTLSILNLKNKLMKPIALNVENVDGFTVYKDNSLLIGALSEAPYGKLIIYDFEKGEIIEEFRNSPEMHFSDLIFDKNDNMLYYTNWALYKHDFTNDEIDKFIDLRQYTGFAFTRIVSDANSFYLLDKVEDRIFCIGKNIIGEEPQNTLTIVSRFHIDFKEAVEVFKKANPNCDIVYKFKGINDLKVSVMAGNKDMDIIYVDSFTFFDFVRSGAAISLDRYQNIREQLTYMSDGIENLCKFNDKLVGVPAWIEMYAWETNQELLDKIGSDLPEENWDWYDFYEYAKLARRDINGDGTKDTYIIEGRADYPPFLQQYNSAYIDLVEGKASFNNDEFKSLLALWKKMWDEDLIMASNKYLSIKMKDNIVFNSCLCSLAMAEKTIINPPALWEGQKSYPARLNLLCINSFSPKKDLAAEFLSVFCSKEMHKKISLSSFMALQDDISIYLPSTSNFSKSNEKNIEIFKHMLKYSAREKDIFDMRQHLFGTIGDYMRGDIALDKAATLIDDKANMVLGE